MDKHDNYYAETAATILTVEKHIINFSCGQMTHAVHSGRSVEITSPETVEKIQVEMTDWTLNVRSIVKCIGFSSGSVVSTLNVYLGMRKLSTRWVPHLLIFHK